MNRLKVVIIGGGPGGTACALALHKFAKERSSAVEIILLCGKRFNLPQSDKPCVGVLSPPLPTLMENELDVPFPREICVGEINQYTLHSAGETIEMADPEEPSVAVQRIQFDAYMLEQIMARKITIIPYRAVDLEFHADAVIVSTENQTLKADMVVGAFGMDEVSAAMFSRVTPYRKPQALESILVDEPLAETEIKAFGSTIQTFLPSQPQIEFGAITPKGDHITINIAGKHVDSQLFHTFLNSPEMVRVLEEIIPGRLDQMNQDPNRMEYSKGRFPRSAAKGFYGDRYVMVGDAAGLVRSFKGKGVTMAMLTGIRAAKTIIQQDITGKAFHDYFRTANQDIIQDLPYGRGMRLATLMMSKAGWMGIVLRAAHKSPSLRSALIGAVSGHMPYREVMAKILHPNVILNILGSI